MPLSKYDIQLDLERTPGTSHAHLVDMVGANKRVLDVGCDTGYLGEALGAFGNTTTGFEINEETAQEARKHLIRVEVGDLEAVDLVSLFGAGSFDVVVFGDVLEHLRDPLPTLRQSRALLAPGGSVLISTPNVAHGDVRLALLEGNFRYNSLGILDETHTRFFTRESLVEFLHDAGFVLLDLRRTRAPLFGTEIEVEERDFDPVLVDRLRADPEATTYQFVVRAVPDDQTQVTSAQALRVDSLTAEVGALRAEIVALRAELDESRGFDSSERFEADATELRHRLLISQDRAIGGEAEAARLLALKDDVEAELAASRTELDLLRQHGTNPGQIAELNALRAELAVTQERLSSSDTEIAAIRGSTTWRIGRAFVAPLARITGRGPGRQR